MAASATATATPATAAHTAEAARLEEIAKGVRWRRWGPYLSERQWGTVREDYSADGNAWDYFPHDHARSRAYRWGEDGIAGFGDDQLYALPRPRPVERQGRDPQGAAVRPDQSPGQSRRRRQGTLLLSRRHADPFLHADALQVSAGRLPLRTAGRRESSPRQGCAGIQADRHRGLCRGRLFRCRDRIRQGRGSTTS